MIIGFLTLVANVMAGIFLSLLQINNSNQSELNAMTDHNVILLTLTSILFAPVVEELVYRYGIYGLFGKKRILGCIITTLLFAFSHVWGYVLIEGGGLAEAVGYGSVM